MADITVTAANVVLVSGSIEHVTAGAAITAGQAVYKDLTDGNDHKPCDADASASAVIAGIALHASEDKQPLAIQTGGTINIGGTVVIGEVYCVSSGAGGVAPDLDVGSNEYRTIIGIGATSANIQLNFTTSGVQVP